jgi:hypothetical protein
LMEWNSMENSMEFHVPWNSMEFHGISSIDGI